MLVEALLNELRVPDHRVHRRPELVGHRRQERALRPVGPLRLPRRQRAPLRLFLQPRRPLDHALLQPIVRLHEPPLRAPPRDARSPAREADHEDHHREDQGREGVGRARGVGDDGAPERREQVQPHLAPGREQHRPDGDVEHSAHRQLVAHPVRGRDEAEQPDLDRRGDREAQLAEAGAGGRVHHRYARDAEAGQRQQAPQDCPVGDVGEVEVLERTEGGKGDPTDQQQELVPFRRFVRDRHEGRYHNTLFVWLLRVSRATSDRFCVGVRSLREQRGHRPILARPAGSAHADDAIRGRPARSAHDDRATSGVDVRSSRDRRGLCTIPARTAGPTYEDDEITSCTAGPTYDHHATNRVAVRSSREQRSRRTQAMRS